MSNPTSNNAERRAYLAFGLLSYAHQFDPTLSNHTHDNEGDY